MTPNEEIKRKELARLYLLLEKEKCRSLGEIDKTSKDLEDLGFKIDLNL